ncbi:MAG: hypothetical protein ABW022_02135 [Actinoplanes sp.]
MHVAASDWFARRCGLTSVISAQNSGTSVDDAYLVAANIVFRVLVDAGFYLPSQWFDALHFTATTTPSRTCT